MKIYSIDQNGDIIESFHEIEIVLITIQLTLSAYCDKDENDNIYMKIF